ncbi:tetrahydrofolate dehydrogenase/cyclohydrolase catalytic domain-containing protein, partial [Microbacterium sp. HSID17254]|uniref:tetrahydrofolate dehydrogenase/cyclohydrolase catalytic domain-containing protein n=1 Tax=Microbacterium sp. HSID17254 TaxID=2419509 RepID=UPI00237A439F
MTDTSQTRPIPGRAILAEVRDTYRDAYAATLQEHGTRMMVVRFEPTTHDTVWAARMEASRVSAEQKVRTFTALGATPDHIVVPDSAGISEIAGIIRRANDDPQVAGIIVQAPPPQPVLALLNEIDPAKDIDALGIFAPRTACATADGVGRVAEPYLPDARIAVVGSRGFVGSGVVTLLRQGGHDPMLFENGDDLRGRRAAEVVCGAVVRVPVVARVAVRREHPVGAGLAGGVEGLGGDRPARLHPGNRVQDLGRAPVGRQQGVRD